MPLSHGSPRYLAKPFMSLAMRILLVLAVILVSGLGILARRSTSGVSPREGASAGFSVAHTDEEWRRRLGAPRFQVMRRHMNEKAKTSPLNEERRRGIYTCAGCGQPVFSSSVKYEHYTGWPSFWEPLPGSVVDSPESEILVKRTGVHCSRCGGHLGLLFDNGPEPTGLRYSINGLSINFVPNPPKGQVAN